MTVLQLVAQLASADTRTSAARELSAALGAQALLVFIRDEEVGVLLSAPGFPQTLPYGRQWRAFLAD